MPNEFSLAYKAQGFYFPFQLMREIRRQEQAEKMTGREIFLAISEAVAATRLVPVALKRLD